MKMILLLLVTFIMNNGVGGVNITSNLPEGSASTTTPILIIEDAPISSTNLSDLSTNYRIAEDSASATTPILIREDAPISITNLSDLSNDYRIVTNFSSLIKSTIVTSDLLTTGDPQSTTQLSLRNSTRFDSNASNNTKLPIFSFSPEDSVTSTMQITSTKSLLQFNTNDVPSEFVVLTPSFLAMETTPLHRDIPNTVNLASSHLARISMLTDTISYISSTPIFPMDATPVLLNFTTLVVGSPNSLMTSTSLSRFTGVLINSTIAIISATTPLKDHINVATSTPQLALTKELIKDSITTKSQSPLAEENHTPIVIARRCCDTDSILDGTKCVPNETKMSFNPMRGAKADAETSKYEFIWETSMLNCTEGLTYDEREFHAKTTLKVDETGSLLTWNDASSVKSTKEYCIGQHPGGTYTALTCIHDVEQLCSNATCIRKCCGPDEIRSYKSCKDKTIDPNHEDEVNYLNITFYTLSGEETLIPDDLQFISLGPMCNYKETLAFSDFDILPTGKLYLKKKGRIVDSEHYCIDYFLELNQNFVVYCFEARSPVQKWKIFLSPICMVLSIIFLIIIIICHLITRELRNAQGLCFLAYCMALLMAYFGFYTNIKFARSLTQSYCVFNGLFSQFSMLSAFFWLSVMCFDIWRVIRATVKCIPLTGILENDTQKFLLYSGYAFGCPILISLITLINQTLPEESTIGMIVPGFGFESCWFVDELSQFIYFYSIIATLNIFSLLMLGHVITMLLEADQGFACFFRGRENSRAFNRKHLALFRQRLSLFAVMAICWSTEVLSLRIPPKDMWVVTDLLNTLQGVIVFIIFIFSKQKRQLVKKALKGKADSIASVLLKRSIRREESVDSHASKGSNSTAKEEVSISSNKEMTEMKSKTHQKLSQESSHSEAAASTEHGPENGTGSGVVNQAFDNEDEFDNSKQNGCSNV